MGVGCLQLNMCTFIALSVRACIQLCTWEHVKTIHVECICVHRGPDVHV